MTNKHAQNWKDLATFTYNQLSDRGRANARTLYKSNDDVKELIAEYSDDTCCIEPTCENIFNALAYKFNAHGERIA
uniref:Uncharacterized protein n=1 Tax=viral metagenome TaxID=1070528 RepID=A0A6M3KWH0_9ZZZZ